MVVGFYFILPSVVGKPLYSLWMSLFSSQTAAYFWGVILMHHGCFAACNYVMLLIYQADLEFFEKYKVSSQPWPWKSDQVEFRALMKRLARTLTVNLALITPGVLLVSMLVGGVRIRFSVEEFPSAWEVLSHHSCFILAEDCLFYWSHRVLHSHPWLYSSVHKQHHEFRITIGIASEYAHPLEFIFGNILPSSAGALLLGSNVHFSTLLAWYALRVCKTTDAHCGYQFAWSPFRLLPFSGTAAFHDYHHSHNLGNYGSFFSLWDNLCGTNKHFLQHLNKTRGGLASID
jgi:sterol desaturase/sphingolipid hydroxylase (fatty acid hydroxylase superfamily)